MVAQAVRDRLGISNCVVNDRNDVVVVKSKAKGDQTMKVGFLSTSTCFLVFCMSWCRRVDPCFLFRHPGLLAPSRFFLDASTRPVFGCR